jgi:hypothetical protein
LAIAVDSSGNVFIAGASASSNFPGSPTFAGGTHDAFVTKLDSTGALKFTTFIGGTQEDAATGIALQGGNIFLAGNTQHGSSFPAINPTIGALGGQDAFVAEFNSSGVLTASTEFGGGPVGTVGGEETAQGIAVDGSGNIYVAGETTSSNFPVSASPFQSALSGASDAFITKLTSGMALSFSTYLGGSGQDSATGVALDSSNNVYISGVTTSSGLGNPSSSTFGGGTEDGFVAEFSSAGSEVYFVYVGGTGDDVADAIAVDGASGTAYVTGSTTSPNRATGSAVQTSLKGSQDAFVAQVNTGGTIALFTYLGGTGTGTGPSGDSGLSIALDSSKNIYVTGVTDSSDFPNVAAITGGTAKQGTTDAFVAKLNTAGSSVVFSSFYGGNNTENTAGTTTGGAVAVDSAGTNIYITGTTNSTTGLPTKNAVQSTFQGGTGDAFAAKITP